MALRNFLYIERHVTWKNLEELTTILFELELELIFHPSLCWGRRNCKESFDFSVSTVFSFKNK